ncbi:anthranilate synthase family protein [Solwaraspora sp. WMMD791]|uniref:anthranilate synthase family protein n=1 Tax=Solwaraspora sp. WMMD791 TaxID=3016086 RepID=UPI00249AAC49|nr:anthranilate synthase family protein [Solwaraspora sp. WMMD791]WFE26110.1 anthranilate synthase family protein [Solwaraspora sp. WMMD791]
MNTPTRQGAGRLLDRILAGEPQAFALLHRPGSGVDTTDALIGEVSYPATLAEVVLPARPAGPLGPAHETLLLVPYRQIIERGFAARDDRAPLVALAISEQETLARDELLTAVPKRAVRLSGGRFDLADSEYAEIIRRIVEHEIGTGTGANFVIKRSFTARIANYSPSDAVALFCRLLEREQGAYWTFVVHTPTGTLVGATPERHVSLDAGRVSMNPISGTYRYPTTGPTLDGITRFLGDQKEIDELYMVLDEELKMMARICDGGGRVVGPYLREMARLAHTEYFIDGYTVRDVREILRETLFAPTVTGSPLESAARVIERYEPQGRRYYGGIAALVGRDATGERTLDSAILIRTADIAPDGRLQIGVGATLVRHSEPDAEVAETHAKAAGLLGVLQEQPPTAFGSHPKVRSALRRRNDRIADFWLRDHAARRTDAAGLAQLRVLVVDEEDTFTAMIGQQLSALGLVVTVIRFDQPHELTGHDLVLLGPGPGDPRDTSDPRIAGLHSSVDLLLAVRQPFVAVCLSHQVLGQRLGLDLVRRRNPYQGTQREIDLFGARERVGFYNTYVLHGDQDDLAVDGIGPVRLSRERRTGEVHALRGPGFASMQFHPESVLTLDGLRITAEALRWALDARVPDDAMVQPAPGRQ